MDNQTIIFGKTSLLSQSLKNIYEENKYHVRIVDSVECDFLEDKSINIFINNIKNQGCHYNTVIFVSGISEAGPIESIPIEAYDRCFDINFWGPLKLFLFFSRWLSNPTTFIFILSGTAEFRFRGMSAYGLSKLALQEFICYLHLEEAYQEKGHRIVSVFPGKMDTPFNSKTKIWGNYVLPEYGKAQNTDIVAKKIFHRVHIEKKNLVRLSFMPKILGFLQQIFPRFITYFINYSYKLFSKENVDN